MPFFSASVFDFLERPGSGITDIVVRIVQQPLERGDGSPGFGIRPEIEQRLERRDIAIRVAGNRVQLFDQSRYREVEPAFDVLYGMSCSQAHARVRIVKVLQQRGDRRVRRGTYFLQIDGRPFADFRIGMLEERNETRNRRRARAAKRKKSDGGKPLTITGAAPGTKARRI